jgi:hypothetical protein
VTSSKAHSSLSPNQLHDGFNLLRNLSAIGTEVLLQANSNKERDDQASEGIIIFPVPFEFRANLPHVSMIRPVTDQFAGAVAAINGFIASGLFIGQSQQFLDLLQSMAAAADAASR